LEMITPAKTGVIGRAVEPSGRHNQMNADCPSFRPLAFVML